MLVRLRCPRGICVVVCLAETTSIFHCLSSNSAVRFSFHDDFVVARILFAHLLSVLKRISISAASDGAEPFQFSLASSSQVDKTIESFKKILCFLFT